MKFPRFCIPGHESSLPSVENECCKLLNNHFAWFMSVKKLALTNEKVQLLIFCSTIKFNFHLHELYLILLA